jgi:hypothetical protein
MFVKTKDKEKNKEKVNSPWNFAEIQRENVEVKPCLKGIKGRQNMLVKIKKRTREQGKTKKKRNSPYWNLTEIQRETVEVKLNGRNKQISKDERRKENKHKKRGKG